MLTGEINQLRHRNEEQRKSNEFLQKELTKRSNQLERLRALEEVFNNGKYEEYQKAQLERPQSDLVAEKVDRETFESQSKLGEPNRSEPMPERNPFFEK